jgi:TrkA domain protein
VTEIREWPLPGVGMSYEFTTAAGARLRVITHRSGRRDISVGTPNDPDAYHTVLELTEDESRTLAELLGGSSITRELTRLRQAVQGLAIDWVPVDRDSPYADKTIGDTRARTRTGVSIVAVVREEYAIPAPGPEFRIEAGDTLVVVGQPRGIESLVELLHSG